MKIRIGVWGLLIIPPFFFLIGLMVVILLNVKMDLVLMQNPFKVENSIQEIVLGIILGTVIAISYFKLGLQEWIVHLQNTFGDYVPVGETSTIVSGHIFLFFIANVLLAPFVEEVLYRNLAFQALREQYSETTTVVITSFFFGILHWLGGFWYILTTAILIGIPFGILQLKRKNILLVFSAHLSLNFIEFILSLDH